MVKADPRKARQADRALLVCERRIAKGAGLPCVRQALAEARLLAPPTLRHVLQMRRLATTGGRQGGLTTLRRYLERCVEQHEHEQWELLRGRFDRALLHLRRRKTDLDVRQWLRRFKAVPTPRLVCLARYAAARERVSLARPTRPSALRTLGEVARLRFEQSRIQQRPSQLCLPF